MRHGLSIAAGVTLLLGTIACADGPEFDPQRVEVNQASGKLPDGRRWRARYYFDRNALAATALTGDTVVALTSTGNLLAINATFLNILAERVPPRAATCLGTGVHTESEQFV